MRYMYCFVQEIGVSGTLLDVHCTRERYVRYMCMCVVQVLWMSTDTCILCMCVVQLQVTKMSDTFICVVRVIGVSHSTSLRVNEHVL